MLPQQFDMCNTLAIGDNYMDGRDKAHLCMPDKSFKKGIPKWNLQKTCDGDCFIKSTRQEADVYDLNYLKYMRTLERGMTRPKPMSAIAFPKLESKETTRNTDPKF